MALFSFLRKKPEQLFSSATPTQNTPQKYQASGYGSQYYQTKSPSQPSNTNYSNNYSKAPYQASGPDARFAGNASNYKPPTPTYQPPAPQPTGQQISPFQQFLDRQRQQSQESVNRQKGYADEQADRLRKIQQGQRQSLESQIPTLQSRFDTFKDQTGQRINQLAQITDEQKQNIRTQSGEALRSNAQTNRENQQSLQELFAGLGTLDSDAFQNQASRQANAFTRQQNTQVQQMTQQLNQADRELANAKLEAQNIISAEQAKLEDAVRAINMSIQQGTLEYDQAIADVYNQYQQSVDQIESALIGYETSVEEMRQNLSQQALKDQDDRLSDEFLLTGNPTNRADYIYQLENKDKESNLTEKQKSFLGAANIAQEALSKLNTGNVNTGLGYGFLGNIGEKLNLNSPEQQAYRSDIATARTAAKNALLGANMSPAEMESLMAAIPEYNDSPDVARQKLQSFIYNMNILANPSQNYQVSNQQAQSVNNDPLGIM